MREFLQRIIGLALLRMLLDLLLPEGDNRRYADFGAGLCMTVCMLQALQGLLRGFT